MYDILVIGGGLLGTAIARDAALRGLSVALFERDDFGAHATSHLNRLVTGSLSALHTLDFTRVREDLREREILLQIAPHLVEPLTCLVPFYGQGLLAQTRLRASLALADALGLDTSLPLHQILSPTEALDREPSLRPEGLAGAALVWEAWVPQIERLALEMALDARDHGARLHTHTEVETLRWEHAPRGRERVTGVAWRDRLTGDSGESQASLVINATGAWQYGAKSHLQGQRSDTAKLRKSVSVVVAPLRGQRDALLFPREDESRPLHVLPLGQASWIGGMETDFQGDPDTLFAAGEETLALLRAVQTFLPEMGENRMALAAVYPSVPSVTLPPTPHPYRILDHAVEGGTQEGYLSIAGGSLTACRSIAEEVVDLSCRKLGRALATPASRTASTPLPGARGRYRSPKASWADAPVLRAEVERAVREEECKTLCDFLERRTALFWSEDQGLSVTPPVLATMASLLGWNEGRRERELKAYEAAVALTQAFRVM